MTAFGPPPVPPMAQVPYSVETTRTGPAPWSAAAIAAFVLALLGFLGFTAVLALVFAIVAFFTTRGGRRRGLGLAIAAIPISLLTGVFAVVVVAAFLVWGQMLQVPNKLETVFSTSAEPAAQVAALRELTSSDFDDAVDDKTMTDWLGAVRAKHGGLTGVSVDAQSFQMSPEGATRMTVHGKFVNGPADVRLTFDPLEIWSGSIRDIEVDGVSPRGAPKDAAP